MRPMFYHIKTPLVQLVWNGEIEIDGANTWLVSPNGEKIASVLSRHVEKISESQYGYLVKRTIWDGETAFSNN